MGVEATSEMIIDKGFESLLQYSPVCGECVHLTNNDPNNRVCKAFKDIPLSIWNGENDHTRPVRGDNGVRFEQRSR